MEKLALKLKSALLSAVSVDHPVKQGVTTAVLSALAIQARSLVVPVVILLGLMITDFATGMRAASHRGEEISSEKYFTGLEKKVYLLVLVGIGLVIDLLIVYTAQSFDLSATLPVTMAVIVSLWLIVNEVISILENIQDMGVALPSWLLPMAKNIKSKVESKAPKIKEDSDHE